MTRYIDGTVHDTVHCIGAPPPRRPASTPFGGPTSATTASCGTSTTTAPTSSRFVAPPVLAPSRWFEAAGRVLRGRGEGGGQGGAAAAGPGLRVPRLLQNVGAAHHGARFRPVLCVLMVLAAAGKVERAWVFRCLCLGLPTRPTPPPPRVIALLCRRWAALRASWSTPCSRVPTSPPGRACSGRRRRVSAGLVGAVLRMAGGAARVCAGGGRLRTHIRMQGGEQGWRRAACFSAPLRSPGALPAGIQYMCRYTVYVPRQSSAHRSPSFRCIALQN